MMDLVLRNGLVFDGLGSPPARRDIGIRAGKVALIAREITEPADRVVDVSGKWIAPGFIDIHTHYDIEVEIAPGLSESVRHGVTSVVMGNCSLSLTVGEPAILADIFQRVETLSPVLIAKWLSRSVSWKSPAEYLAHLRSLPLGPSVAPLYLCWGLPFLIAAGRLRWAAVLQAVVVLPGALLYTHLKIPHPTIAYVVLMGAFWVASAAGLALFGRRSLGLGQDRVPAFV